MAYSINTVIADGSTNQFAINFTLGYLSRDDVQVRVNAEVDGLGAPVYRALTWINDALVQVGGATIVNGDVLTITRTVDKTELAHDYADGEAIDETNLDDSFKQVIMAVHEFLDGRIDAVRALPLDMGNNKIIRLGNGVADTDAANMGQMNAAVATATTQAGIATTQAGVAATQAGIATTQAGVSTTQATSSYNSFLSIDKKYLGAKISDPTLDNQGAALATGALYFNSVSNVIRKWSGAAWADVLVPAAGSITSAMLGTDSVTSTKIMAQNVLYSKLATDTMTLRDWSTKNYLVNGSMKVWQLQSGTAQLHLGNPWADNWKYTSNFTGEAVTANRIGKVYSAGLGNAYFPPNMATNTRLTNEGQDWGDLSFMNISTNGTGTVRTVTTYIEQGDALSGRQVTCSFYVSNGSGSTMTFGFDTITNFGTGGTPQADIVTTKQTDTVAAGQEKVFTFTQVMPIIGGYKFGTNNDSYIGVRIYLPTAAGFFNLANVQLVEGPVRSYLPPKTYAEEMLACQRLIPCFDVDTASATPLPAYVLQTAATTADIVFPFGVETRLPVTGIQISAVGHYQLMAPTAKSFTGITFTRASRRSAQCAMTGLTGLSAGFTAYLQSINASAKIYFTGASF